MPAVLDAPPAPEDAPTKPVESKLDPAHERALLYPSSPMAGSAAAAARPGDDQRSLREQEISALLTNKVVHGVGPKLAASLLRAFGERTLDVLRGDGSAEEEARLLDLPTMGEKKLAKVRASL